MARVFFAAGAKSVVPMIHGFDELRHEGVSVGVEPGQELHVGATRAAATQGDLCPGEHQGFDDAGQGLGAVDLGDG